MTSQPPASGASAPIVVEVVAWFGDRVVDVRHVTDGRYVIGEGPQADLAVALPAGVDRAGTPLVIALADQLVLGLVPGMTGEIVQPTRTILLADLLAQGRKSYAMARGDRCEAVLGGLRFTLATVDPAVFAATRRPLDRLYAASNLGALLVVGALVLLGEPRLPGELALEEVAASRERAVRYLTDLPTPPPEPQRPRPHTVAVSKARSTPKPTTPAAPAPVLETTATPTLLGGAVKPPKHAQGSRRGIRDDFDTARSAGALGDGEFVDSIEQNTAAAQEGLLGYDNAADTKMWNAFASAPARVRPMGGLELADTERGGGVHGEKKPSETTPGKAVAIDVYATPGATAAERAIARMVVTIRFETPYVRGDMNTDSVQTALRKQSDGLSRCYKQVAQAEVKQGTVLFKLKVSVDGRVTAASLDFGSSTFGDIGPCISAAARAWTFPAPLDHKPATIAVEARITAKPR